MGASTLFWLTLALASPPAEQAAPPSSEGQTAQLAAVTVEFGWDETGLTAEARQLLDDFILLLPEPETVRLRIVGHTDRTGSPEYARGLSQRMAQSVRDYLVSRGVGADGILIEAMGGARPVVETAQGVREPKNRRVEIFVCQTTC
jgi:OmpA-OmpF porin, OOP family